MMVQITAEAILRSDFLKPLLNLEPSASWKLSAGQIEDEMKQAISKAQHYQADIFGWGRLLEREYPPIWSQVEQDWPQIFSGLQADIQVNFELRRTYLTDESFVIR